MSSDPRIQPSTTVNETLLDRFIRHLLYLTRLQNHEVGWMLAQVNGQLMPVFVDQSAGAVNRLIQMGSGANIITKNQARYLASFEKRIMTASSGIMDRIQTGFLSRLINIGQHEQEFSHRLIEKTIPIKWNFKTPARDQLESYLKTQPFSGRPLDKWFYDLNEQTIARLTTQIRQGLINGESIDRIMRRIRGTRKNSFMDGVLQTTRAHAEALARSGVIFASSQASESFYRENSDLISKEQWVATLDARTCEQCGSLDGKTFPIGAGIRPPAHINCRCVMVPVTKSWKELGIDLAEAPEGTRASMNGQVPESLTYNEWLRRQPDEVIREALGKTRARLFKQGKLSVSSFVNRQGWILNLNELRNKEKDVFDKLNISLN